MNAPTEIQKLVDLIDPHADELNDRDVNKIFDAARRVHNAGYRPAGAATSAFPSYLGNRENWDLGMTLRDYFAAQSITGCCPGNGLTDEEVFHHAQWAYRMADAMLEARKK